MKCEKCGGIMTHNGIDRYKCVMCNYEELDDFGKVKKFLEENGVANKLTIAKETGVSSEKIETFFNEGRLEVHSVDGLCNVCKKCGCIIDHGRYCKECTTQTFDSIKKAFQQDEIKSDEKMGTASIMGKIRSKSDKR